MGRGEELNSSPLQREHEAERGKSCYIKNFRAEIYYSWSAIDHELYYESKARSIPPEQLNR